MHHYVLTKNGKISGFPTHKPHTPILRSAIFGSTLHNGHLILVPKESTHMKKYLTAVPMLMASLAFSPLLCAQTPPSMNELLLSQTQREQFLQKCSHSVVRVFVTHQASSSVPTSPMLFDGAAVVLPSSNSDATFYLSTLDWLHGATQIEISPSPDTRLKATIERADEANNLAILKTIPVSSLKASKLASAPSPLAFAILVLPQQHYSLAEGSFSANEPLRYGQTSLKLSNGYPLFNAHGEVLGVVVRQNLERYKSDVVHYQLIEQFLSKEKSEPSKIF